MQPYKIVSREEWTVARKAHLAHEKELTRARDRLSAERRELPWVRVEKVYVFDGPNGKETLADLFGGRSQLIVNHFMLGPGWKEGCIGCSFGADNVQGALVHLAQRDVAYVAVSRAPLAEIEAYRKRMGWISSGCHPTAMILTTIFTSRSGRRTPPRARWNIITR